MLKYRHAQYGIYEDTPAPATPPWSPARPPADRSAMVLRAAATGRTARNIFADYDQEKKEIYYEGGATGKV